MFKCIQINLNHCEAAQNLLEQTARESEADILLISEPYKVPNSNNRWVCDKTRKAAIVICESTPFQQIAADPQEGFAYAQYKGVHFYSCYSSPNSGNTAFEETINRLVDHARGKKPIIIAGDFNAWAVEWGSQRTTYRGASLLEAFASLDITLLTLAIIVLLTTVEHNPL